MVYHPFPLSGNPISVLFSTFDRFRCYRITVFVLFCHTIQTNVLYGKCPALEQHWWLKSSISFLFVVSIHLDRCRRLKKLTSSGHWHKFTDKSFLCCCCKSFHIKFEFDFECEVFKRFESAYLMETDSIFSHLIDDRPTMDTDNEMEWMMKIKQTLLHFLRYSNCRCWCCFYRKSQRKQYLPIELKIH